MLCTFCKQGQTEPGVTTVLLERSGCTIIIKEVPADICENCGEYFLSQQMTQKVLAMAEDAIAQGAELEIRRFAA